MPIPPVRLHPGMKYDQLITALNENMNRIQNTSTTQIIRDDSGNERIIIGRQPDDTWGIKITKPNFDVSTAGVNDFIFNSDNNIFKIVATGTANLAVPDPFNNGASVTATIPHNLGITPAFLAFVNIPAGSGIYGTGLGHIPAFTMGNGSVTTYTQGTADTVNLYLKVTNVFGANLSGAPFGSTWTCRYYILRETAS